MKRYLTNLVFRPFVVRPSFFLVGAQKSGTTSLFSYVCQHPRVLKPAIKEPYYYGRKHSRGKNWYMSVFPLSLRSDAVTGDASTDSLSAPGAALLVRRDWPEAKIVMILRNPVERTISHYFHNVRRGRERRPIREAVFAQVDGPYKNIHVFGYLQNSCYSEHVPQWIENFGRERVFIEKTSTLARNPSEVVSRVFSFLDLEPFSGVQFSPENVGRNKEPVSSSLTRELREYFLPYNDKLARLLGDSSWCSDWDSCTLGDDGSAVPVEK